MNLKNFPTRLKVATFLFIFQVFCISSLYSQVVEVTVTGLKPGDSCQVTIQQGPTDFFVKTLNAGLDSSGKVQFKNINSGFWQLKIHTIGYLHPPAQLIEVKGQDLKISLNVKLIRNNSYEYEWRDDSSFVGHAMMSYINVPREVIILNDTLKVPNNFSSHNLTSQYGVLLSNEKGNVWSEEEAYRLFNTFKRLPENDYQCFLCTGNQQVKSVWTITEENLFKDIEIRKESGILYVKISKAAFTYSEPMVVLYSGVRGTFYSKRLFHAILNFSTDFGSNKELVQEIAQKKYGFEFLEPSIQLEQLMKETRSNFQSFHNEEKIEILSMIEELPTGFHRQAGLKYMCRRINGQDHPKYWEAPAIAWTGLNTIEFIEKAFKNQTLHSIQRLILHEKAHFLWEYTFDQTLRNDWTQLGGWFKDPNASSGWSTVLTTEFVSAYAHAKNPNEDMAETIASYVTNPDLLRNRSYRKFEFIRDRVMHGTQYLAKIREDLTFQVYNLFPDFNYPGKIKKVRTSVSGAPQEDKVLEIEIELETFGNPQNGASNALMRLVSEVGTFQDMWLTPTNQHKNILKGRITLSKYASSGYWRVNQIRLTDEVGNERFENNNHFGLLTFVNNPLEDFKAPWYVNRSLILKDTTARFTNTGLGVPDPRGEEMKALKIQWKMEEKTLVEYVWSRLFLENPKLQAAQIYSRDVGIGKSQIVDNTLDKSVKTATVLIPIPDYYPSGYYTLSNLILIDVAGNTRWVYLDKDTTNKQTFDPNNINTGNQRDLRDSIYIETKYPDYLAPILDVNRIRIKATPSKPEAPDGETLFEIWILAKDTSHYPGFASGYMGGSYTLRDPQGKETVQYYTLGFLDEYYTLNRAKQPEIFKEYYAKVLLPKGSAPGIWGVSEISISDKALNSRKYSFVEYIRFDLLDAPISRNPQLKFSTNQVNVTNSQNLKTWLLCKECNGLNYQLSLYSSGGGKIVKFTGKIIKDTTILSDLVLTGVSDGVLYGSVLILDSLNRQVGSTFSSTFFDLSVPKGFTGKLPLYHFGKQVLDGITYQVKTEEEKGNYIIRIVALGQVKDSFEIKGTFTQKEFSVPGLSIRNFSDGPIRLDLIIIDTAGNAGEPFKQIFTKDTRPPSPKFTSVQLAQTDRALLETLELNFSEALSDSLSIQALKVKNGTILDLKRKNDSLYQIVIDTKCSQESEISINSNHIRDLAGNKPDSNVVFLWKRIQLAPQGIIVTGLKEPCQKDTASYPIVTMARLEDYSFTWKRDGVNIPSQQTPILKPKESGMYSLSLVYKGVCQVSSDSVRIIFHKEPDIPILKQVDTLLTSVNSTRNNWRLDGILIASGHIGSLPIRKSGRYQAQAINEPNCKSEWSLPLDILTTGSNDKSSFKSEIKLYPNPAFDLIQVISQKPLLGVPFEVLSYTGQLISNGKLDESLMLNIRYFPSGIYLLRLYIDEQVKIIRFIKANE
jgi:hypothetical protein